jgi:tripartite ATP-independent transporter DctM subunit
VIATAYALCLSFWYRALSFKQFGRVLVESTAMSSSIIFIIAGASAFSWIIAMEGIPQTVTSWLLSVTSNKYMILFLLNVVLLIMGMFMESLAILMIMVPFLMPLITVVGIDPVHLGVVVVLNLMIGLSTPPVGLSLFICNSIAGTKLEDVYKAIIPFLIPLIGVLALITVFPALVTALPKYVLK